MRYKTKEILENQNCCEFVLSYDLLLTAFTHTTCAFLCRLVASELRK